MRERFRSWADSGLPPETAGTVVTVGMFDGVHRGHQDVLSIIARRAGETALRSVLVTFAPHPLEVLNPSVAPALLTVGAEKSEVLAESGIHYLVVVPFTQALASYTATQFVDELLLRRLHMRELVIGYDHRFGRGREGNAEVLRELGGQRGFRVEIVPPVTAEDGRPASSTLIRRAVAGGDLTTAARGLGRLYSVSGRVVRGEARGRLLGFPTINLGAPPARKLLPPEGVYAVRTQTPYGCFGGMMNLGPRPTFGDTAISLEIHLFDAEVQLYDAHVKVEFVARLRDTRKFASAERLIAQLHSDAIHARDALTLLSNRRIVNGST